MGASIIRGHEASDIIDAQGGKTGRGSERRMRVWRPGMNASVEREHREPGLSRSEENLQSTRCRECALERMVGDFWSREQPWELLLGIGEKVIRRASERDEGELREDLDVRRDGALQPRIGAGAPQGVVCLHEEGAGRERGQTLLANWIEC